MKTPINHLELLKLFVAYIILFFATTFSLVKSLFFINFIEYSYISFCKNILNYKALIFNDITIKLIILLINWILFLIIILYLKRKKEFNTVSNYILLIHFLILIYFCFEFCSA